MAMVQRLGSIVQFTMANMSVERNMVKEHSSGKMVPSTVDNSEII
jgi:hypothetical protein